MGRGCALPSWGSGSLPAEKKSICAKIMQFSASFGTSFLYHSIKWGDYPRSPKSGGPIPAPTPMAGTHRDKSNKARNPSGPPWASCNQYFWTAFSASTMTSVLLGALWRTWDVGYEGGCAGQTRKHTLGCTADIWDQLLLGCAGGACGNVDLQLLDLTPDRVCSDHWRRHFSVHLCRFHAFPDLRWEYWTCSW